MDCHQTKHSYLILSEYDADNIKESAASKPNMKLEAKEELITRNSPTKPDVPGSPELAMRKKSS